MRSACRAVAETVVVAAPVGAAGNEVAELLMVTVVQSSPRERAASRTSASCRRSLARQTGASTRNTSCFSRTLASRQ